MDDHLIVTGYHLMLGGGGLVTLLLGIYGALYRIWFKPVKDWRTSVDKKQIELKHEFELFKNDVNRSLTEGTEQFNELKNDLNLIREDVRRMSESMIRLEAVLKYRFDTPTQNVLDQIEGR